MAASIINFILSSLISDSYVIQRGSISYQKDPPPYTPTLYHPTTPGRILCIALVTIPSAGPPSLI